MAVLHPTGGRGYSYYVGPDHDVLAWGEGSYERGEGLDFSLEERVEYSLGDPSPFAPPQRTPVGRSSYRGFSLSTGISVY